MVNWPFYSRLIFFVMDPDFLSLTIHAVLIIRGSDKRRSFPGNVPKSTPLKRKKIAFLPTVAEKSLRLSAKRENLAKLSKTAKRTVVKPMPVPTRLNGERF